MTIPEYAFVIGAIAATGLAVWILTRHPDAPSVTDQFKAMLEPSELERARQDFADQLFRDFVADEKERRKAVEASRHV